MHERREPTLSTGDSDTHEQERRTLREPVESNNEEPPLVLWVAAIALGLLLGGLGVKLITDWYESRHAEAVVQRFAAAINALSEQANRQRTPSMTVAANPQLVNARSHAAAVAEKERAQEAALNAERQRIERLRVAAAEQAAAQKTRHDAAWAEFHRPSPACRDPESRATKNCAKELARAQKQFQLWWSQRAL